MATTDAIARIRDTALRSLKETGPQIAAQLGIEPPKLDFFFKDNGYQQAQELTALAEFNTRLLAALQTQEGEDNAESSSTTTKKRRPDRPAVSER
jgi:hypothetical protein